MSRAQTIKDLIQIGEFRLKLYPQNFTLVRAFYEETLGFPVTKEWYTNEDDQGVMFTAGGAILELLSPEHGYKKISGCTLSLEVTDVWELWKKFKHQDNVVFEIRDNDWGDTSFKITDPEGFEITFFTET